MTQPDDRSHRRGPLAALRSNFLTGLIAIAPIGLTLWLIWTAVNWIDSWVIPFIPRPYRPETLLGWDVPGTGVLIFLVFTVTVGWGAKGLIGRTFIRWGELIVARMPIVRSIYHALKQIAETVFTTSDSNFDRACLLEYPRQGIWAVGFISSTTRGELGKKLDAHGPLVSVFLPTTPNPTSGFLLFVPISDVIVLDMNIEDAAKLIISAGLVYPSARDEVVHAVEKARTDHP
ncbi:DUF502 domain-containing protein [Roseicitreum antarcticum]|uniref:Uncharacterized membrane protein n=1 Tax=Roseicitreum antarcticum TaxID=564137 RepID=A0A1H3BJG3_9RHOB|nr:DUF502 domain-containing protein [Roseicitreum antarcticum]SDX41219.1 Uncharacterized membrane protein [Roseicitreum antarcticum]